MLPRSRIRPAYSRAERISDAVIHFAGVGLAILALPALIVSTVIMRGDGASIAASTIYGLCLLAMLGASALYNTLPSGWQRLWLRKLDHAAIYWKIAGTFTPMAVLSGGQAAWILTGIWGAALGGTLLKLFAIHRFAWAALALYLGMGWIGVAASWPLLGLMPTATVVLMAVGGSLYTLGVAFYLWKTLPFHYTIWHGFVLIASLAFFAAVMVLVASPA